MQAGCNLQAKQFHAAIQRQGLLSSREAVFSLLQECIQKKDLVAGRDAHCLMAISELDSVSILSDRLIHLFAICKSLFEVNLVFCRAGNLSIHTWHGIISTHVFTEEYDIAFSLYYKMQEEGFIPDSFVFSIILKACSSIAALFEGRKIHNDLTKTGEDANQVIKTALIDMYAKHGCLLESKEVFSKYQNHDSVLVSAMIAAYAQHRDTLSAFELFCFMLEEDIEPDNVVLLCMLKVCVCMEALGYSFLMHYYILVVNLESEIVIGNTLIDSYGKCGSFEDATQVFYVLPSRDLISWSAMVTGSAHNEKGMHTLILLDQMQQEGLEPDQVIFSTALKACSSMEAALGEANMIYAMILERGLEKEVIVDNSLIHVYAKYGHLDEALRVFHQSKCWNVVSWNVIIAGLTQNGQGLLAIDLFEKMHCKAHVPDKNTWLSLLRACIDAQHLQEGRHMHSKIIQSGFECDVALTNALIDFYMSCDHVGDAYSIFKHLHKKDASTWNVMTAAFLQDGHEVLAIELFEQMNSVDVKPSKHLFFSVLKLCIKNEVLIPGRMIHQLVVYESLEQDPSIGSSLVDMYAKCGSLNEAHAVFKGLSNRNVVLWSSIIAGYDQHGHSKLALDLYVEMLEEDIKPDSITFVSVLKACCNIGAVFEGMFLHDQVARIGLLSELMVGNTLIDLYAKCGCLNQAQKVFDGLPNRDAVSWGALINGYVQYGYGVLAVELFAKMLHAGMEADEITYSSILKACNSLGSVQHGMIIHDLIVRSGIPWNTVVGNTLVDVYSRFGYLDEADKEFNKISDKDVVSWNTIISGFSQHDEGFSALALFNCMQSHGFKPDNTTFICTLKACGMTGSVKYGRLIHDKLIRSGVLLDTTIGNTLLDMYANGGSLDEAQNSFDRLPLRNIVSWNAMISGYAQLGDHTQVKECFQDMQYEGLKPDGWTYTSMLTSCRSCGFVEEGQKYLLSMKDLHGVTPSIEHFNCAIELLGGTGRLYEADKVLKTMPILPDLTGWLTLLTACRLHGNCDIGTTCFDKAMHIDPHHGGGYVALSNIYAEASKLTNADRLQTLRKGVSAWKKPGMAWIELHDTMHEFIVADKAHHGDLFFNTKLHLIREKESQVYIPYLDGVLEVNACKHDGLSMIESISKYMATTLYTSPKLLLCMQCDISLDGEFK